MRFGRARGAWLRLAYHRWAALVSGFVLFAVAAILALIDRPWESWLTDGLALVCGATGFALLFMAFGGRKPDWIEEGDDERGSKHQ